MTRHMTWRAMALALTAISVYAQEQAKTDLGDDFVPGSRVVFATVLPEVLPQRFTMESEISGPDSWYQDILFADDEDPYFATIRPGLDGGLAGPDAFRVVAELGSPA